jgi:putative addiction module killer protein
MPLDALARLRTAIEKAKGGDSPLSDTDELVMRLRDLRKGLSTPRPLYVHRKVHNGEALIAWAKEQGFKTTVPAEELHVTIAYSKRPVDWMAAGSHWEGQIVIPEGGPRMMEALGADGSAKVLLIASDLLQRRHQAIRDAGASWDWPEYQPHITISYAPDAPDLATVEPYRGEIVLGPEIFEEIQEGWADRLIEKGKDQPRHPAGAPDGQGGRFAENPGQGLEDQADGNYSYQGFAIRRSAEFDRWEKKIGDPVARKRIASRILRAEEGNLGDVKALSGAAAGISEMRIDHGPGYRLYFTRREATLIFLLCGGDKPSQSRDIKRAIQIRDDLDKRGIDA